MGEILLLPHNPPEVDRRDVVPFSRKWGFGELGPDLLCIRRDGLRSFRLRDGFSSPYCRFALVGGFGRFLIGGGFAYVMFASVMSIRVWRWAPRSIDLYNCRLIAPGAFSLMGKTAWSVFPGETSMAEIAPILQIRYLQA